MVYSISFAQTWVYNKKEKLFRENFAFFATYSLHFYISFAKIWRKNNANILRKKCENSRKSSQNVTEKFRLFLQNVSFAGNL